MTTPGAIARFVERVAMTDYCPAALEGISYEGKALARCVLDTSDCEPGLPGERTKPGHNASALSAPAAGAHGRSW
jgi:hypothetical protein